MTAPSTRRAAWPCASEPEAQLALLYRVEAPQPNTHRYAVTLRIPRPAPRQRLSLPVWIPGSYLVREFAQHLQGLHAEVDGRPVSVRQLDKCSWEVAAGDAQVLTLRYEVHAFDTSVRAAYLDGARAFFNPTSLCLRVLGREASAHLLDLPAGWAPRGWKVATALTPVRVNRGGFGRYLAASYDELADSPVEIAPFWEGRFTVRGVPHRLVLSGAGPHVDTARLLRDTQRICETAVAFWHGADEAPPINRYVFLLNVTQSDYGGLEHRHSTALICGQADLPALPATDTTPSPLLPGDGYTTLLGLISHEYFHTWNVKRLRPAEFRRYDYQRENHTELLWLFEGFTSYYDDLLLRRAGLINDVTYLELLQRAHAQVLQTPGRQVQSLAQASFDAWTKFYRRDANTANITVSYYTKGALVALCLDLSLRLEGHASLDELMRRLWRGHGDGPLRESDLLRAVARLGGEALREQVQRWVHGTEDLPVLALLRRMDLPVPERPLPLEQRLGLRLEVGPTLRVKQVLRDSAAERAGMAPGDEWLGIEVTHGEQTSAWRMHKLDDLERLAGGTCRAVVLVARDARLLRGVLDWRDAPRQQAHIQANADGPADAPWRQWLKGGS